MCDVFALVLTECSVPDGRTEGNALFTVIWLVHIVKDLSDSERDSGGANGGGRGGCFLPRRHLYRGG